MARIRTIKPDFFRHEGLQDLEAANPGAYVMLVFAGLWGHCDKAGRFEWKPRTLKLDILPFLNFDMERTLQLLCEAKSIRKYEVDGRFYGEITTFPDHQRIGGKELQEAGKFPAPRSEADENDTGSDGEAIGKHLPAQEGKGREGKGVGNGEAEGKPETSSGKGAPKSRPPSPADLLSDVDHRIVADFLAIRKAKRAPLTETAVAGLRREAAKAGLTLEAALAQCCERGWSGFNADWDGVRRGQNEPAPLPRLTA